MNVAPLSAKAASLSSSDYSDTQTSVSESHSNQSLSVGYYPSENTFYYEDMIYEEKPSMDSSACFLPPTQGAWGTESLRRCFRRREQRQGAPERFCQLSILLAWDVDAGFERAASQADLDLGGYNQGMDKWLGEETKLTSDKLENLVQKLETFLENEKPEQDHGPVLPESTQDVPSWSTSSSPPHPAQACHGGHSSEYKPAGNNDAASVPGSPPRLQEPDTQERKLRVSPTETSSTSTSMYTTFCLNFRWAFCWLRKRLFSRWRRDHHPDQPKKSCSQRVNRIQPQEAPLTRPDF